MKLLPVKSFQETLHRGYCGPAVLKMALAYYGINVSEKKLARLAKVSKMRGVDDKTLVAVLKQFQLRATIKNNASFSDIKKYLDKNIPVIVNWFSHGRRDYPDTMVADGHYSVAVGLDARHIYLQDPELGRMRKLKREDFLRVWFDYTGEYLRSEKQLIIRQLIAVFQ